MPTLNECIEQIGVLVKKKEFTTDTLFLKLVWAMVELAEAMDIVKKRGLPPADEVPIVADNIAEELIDVIFYVCDAYRLLRRRYPYIMTMDDMFNHKMLKNMSREKRYGQGLLTSFMKVYIDHMAEEGILDEFMNETSRYVFQLQEKNLRDLNEDRKIYPPTD